jgi:hypothetical protein
MDKSSTETETSASIATERFTDELVSGSRVE